MKSLANYLTSAFVAAGLLFNVASAESLSGKVYDALTSQTMNSFPVQLDQQNNLTDDQGNFTFNVPQGNHHLKISDNITNYFNYEEDINLTTTLQRNVYMIPVRQVDTPYYPDFLAKLKNMTNTDGSESHSGGNTMIGRWHNEYMPIPVWYNEQQAIDVFTQFYGTDRAQSIANKYFDICDRALTDWNQKSGLNLLKRTDHNPDVGIENNYLGSPRVEIRSFFPDKTPQRGILFIDYADPNIYENMIKMIYEHELGHCLRLDHSGDPNDIMNFGITAEGISQNEADIVHIIYTLPNFTDMDHYNNNKTRNAVKDWNLYQ